MRLPAWLRSLDWQTLSTRRYYRNTPLEWLIALGVVVGVVLACALVVRFLRRHARKVVRSTATSVDDVVAGTLGSTQWYSYLAFGVLCARPLLSLSARAAHTLDQVLVVALLLQIGVWAQACVRLSVESWSARSEDRRSATMLAGMNFIAKLGIWALIGLLLLSNFGIRITALVAGLGVGGVAAALAVQSLLSDVFASLSMYFDRPFDIGDFIVVGDYMGSVTKIGMRTTRVRSLGGEEIIFANGEIVKQRIRNYARMTERRIVFGFGIEYNQPYEKVAGVAKRVRSLIERVSDVRFDRAHFKGYGDSSLDFEVVYYVLSPDYNLYMDKQQEINLALYRDFAEADIPFAFPTRTLHVELPEGVTPALVSASNGQRDKPARASATDAAASAHAQPR